MIETIACRDQVLAILVRGNYRASGIQFFTPDNFSQQLAYMNRATGYVIPPHVHNPQRREVQFTNEVLFIKSGRVRVDLYDSDKVYAESRVLEVGDVILLVSGGHGFEMLEDTEMIEVKQGPYTGEGEKTRFEPVSAAQIVVRGPRNE
jgi:mannose-6-phosphate isomerase-like protein (cupin superfamily)